MGGLGFNDLAQACKEGRVSPEETFEKIAVAVYGDPSRFGFDSEDDAAEALYRYRGRVKGLALRYTDRGVPFEAYLVTSLRFLARSIRREIRRHREREEVCERSEGWAAESRSGGPVSAIPSLDGSEALSQEPSVPSLASLWAASGRDPSISEIVAVKTRIVFLILKCAWDVDEAAVRKAAAAAEVPADWLSAAVAQCRRSLEGERLRFEQLCGRRDRAWGRICLLEGRMRLEVEDASKERLLIAIEKERRRLERVRKELRVFRPTVPNSVVARVLGVPKGTVDSGLYYLRKREASSAKALL